MLIPIDAANSLLQSVVRWGWQEQILMCRLHHGAILAGLKKCLRGAFHMRPRASSDASGVSTRGEPDMRLFIVSSASGNHTSQRVEITSEGDIWKGGFTSLTLTNAIWEVETSGICPPDSPQQFSKENDHEIPSGSNSSVYVEADTVSLLKFLAKFIRILLGASFTIAQLTRLLRRCDNSVNQVCLSATTKRTDTLSSLEKNSNEVITNPSELLVKLRAYFGLDEDHNNANEEVKIRLSSVCAAVYAENLATPATALRSFFLGISEFIEKPTEGEFEADALLQRIMQCGREKQLTQAAESSAPDAIPGDRDANVARSTPLPSNETFANECEKQFAREPTTLLNGLVLWALRGSSFSYLCADVAFAGIGGGAAGDGVVIPFHDTSFRKNLIKTLEGRLKCYLEGNTEITRQKVEAFVQESDPLSAGDARDDLLDVLGALLASRPVPDYAQWLKNHFRGKCSQIIYTQMLVFTFTEALPAPSFYRACWKILKPELDPARLTEKYSTVAGALARWAFTALQLQGLQKGVICFPPFPAFDIALGTTSPLSQGLTPCYSASGSQRDFPESVEGYKANEDVPSQAHQLLPNVYSVGDSKKDSVRRRRIWYRYIYSAEERRNNVMTE
ncbi:unnamed protein product [Phytomonas sp. EM1]|nr:unnamed protein product [Phytomonas sp. EM1]|eukprot:CCW59792.1 unnamed protein product [Phytomonas sp. isolate EM1]